MDELHEACERLRSASNALSILLLDKNGREIARGGEVQRLDATSLSSLFAGDLTATGLLDSLLADKEFSGQFYQGERTHLHLSLLAQGAILVVLFDTSSSLGLVRLRVKKAAEELNDILERGPGSGGAAPATAVAAGPGGSVAPAKLLSYKLRTSDET